MKLNCSSIERVARANPARAARARGTLPRIFPLQAAIARLPLLLLCLGILSAPNALAQPPADAAAVERGARLFQQYCTECHGRDGRAQLDVIADATDLTMPVDYYNGNSDQDIYNSIANGAGVAMPAWRPVVGSDEAVWDLVYFVKNLWAEQP